MAAGISKIWVMRMPGGMTKIIKSAKPITEADAKDYYQKSFKYRSAVHLNDRDKVWPMSKAIDEAEMNKDYSHFVMGSPVTGALRNVVEV